MGLFIAKESQIAAQLKVIWAVRFPFSSPHHVTVLASLNQRKGFVGAEKETSSPSSSSSSSLFKKDDE